MGTASYQACLLSVCMCTVPCAGVMTLSYSSAAVERDAAANRIMELEKEVTSLKTDLYKVL